MNLKPVYDIIKELENTSGKNDKLDILKRAKESPAGEVLERVLFYTYTPHNRYKISEKILDALLETPSVKTTKHTDFINIFHMLDELAFNNINDELRDKVADFFMHEYSNEMKELYKRMILKDLRIGMSAKSINKVFKKLIPVFDLMLAKKYEDYEEKINEDLIITLKLDGFRCALIKEKGDVRLYSRTGKEFLGLDEIVKEAEYLKDNMVYDGELLATNEECLNSGQLYDKTKKILTKDGSKTGVEFHMFDWLPIHEFKQGESTKDALERKTSLEDHINYITMNNDLKTLVNVPILYIGQDKNKIEELLDLSISQGKEGIMANTASGTYVTKRTKDLLKVKQFHTVDLQITALEEGTGKFKGLLGKVVVDYKGNKLRVGSGISNTLRKTMWENPEKYVGMIIEVGYFEESKNEKGLLSLRFPTFKRFREDKNKPSYS